MLFLFPPCAIKKQNKNFFSHIALLCLLHTNLIKPWMGLNFCLYHHDIAMSYAGCKLQWLQQVSALLFSDCKEEPKLLLSLVYIYMYLILPWTCFPSWDRIRGIQALQWARDRDVGTWQELRGSEWCAEQLMKPPRKADVFAFMLKENNNNNLRLLKSTALTALENASHLSAEVKQPLLLLFWWGWAWFGTWLLSAEPSHPPARLPPFLPSFLP